MKCGRDQTGCAARLVPLTHQGRERTAVLSLAAPRPLALHTQARCRPATPPRLLCCSRSPTGVSRPVLAQLSSDALKRSVNAGSMRFALIFANGSDSTSN